MAKQRKKRKPRLIPPRVDPDEAWNEKHGADSGKDNGLDWEDADKLCNEIAQKMADASDKVWERAAEFFEGIEETITSMQETITRNQRVSQKQMDALKNMSAGVDKWVDR
jgi:hypothetical protein